jgi:hypothetical protein
MEKTKAEKLEISLYVSYGGRGVSCDVKIDGKVHVLEVDSLINYLEKQITEKGYKVTKTNRQKYPRIIIND